MPKTRSRLDSLFVAQALRSLGWEQTYSRRTRKYGKQKMWQPRVNGRPATGKEWAEHRAAKTGVDLDTINI
jgi:hypothetical protein